MPVPFSRNIILLQAYAVSLQWASKLFQRISPLWLSHLWGCSTPHWGTSSNSIHSTDIAFYTFKALKLISYRAKVWVWAGCEKEKHIQWKLQGEFREMKCNYPGWNLARATLLQTPWDLSDHTWTSASCLLQRWGQPQQNVLSHQVQERDYYTKSHCSLDTS